MDEDIKTSLMIYIGLITVCDAVTLLLLSFIQDKLNLALEWFEGSLLNIANWFQYEAIDLFTDLLSLLFLVTVFWAITIPLIVSVIIILT